MSLFELSPETPEAESQSFAPCEGCSAAVAEARVWTVPLCYGCIRDWYEAPEFSFEAMGGRFDVPDAEYVERTKAWALARKARAA